MLPGETALVFYRAKNTGKEDLIGIATYNMTPEKVSFIQSFVRLQVMDGAGQVALSRMMGLGLLGGGRTKGDQGSL